MYCTTSRAVWRIYRLSGRSTIWRIYKLTNLKAGESKSWKSESWKIYKLKNLKAVKSTSWRICNREDLQPGGSTSCLEDLENFDGRTTWLQHLTASRPDYDSHFSTATIGHSYSQPLTAKATDSLNLTDQMGLDICIAQPELLTTLLTVSVLLISCSDMTLISV